MFKFLLVTLMTFFVGIHSVEANINPNEEIVSAYVVNTVTSFPGEKHNEFVLRVAHLLSDWTKETRTDACGMFGENSKGDYKIILTTQKSQILCFVNDTVAEGYVSLNESIHSNPLPKGKDSLVIKLNYQDKMFGDVKGDGVYVFAKPCKFSDDDFQNGSGYLVACNNLYYQHGKGTSKLITSLHEL